MSNFDGRVYLFSERTEAFSSAVTLAFLFLVPLEFFFFPWLFVGSPSRVIAMTYWLFYLSVAHQAASVALLLTLPEFTAWMRERANGSLWKFPLQCALFATAVFAVVFCLTHYASLVPAFIVAGYVWFHYSAGLWHATQQFKGLSLQYNQCIRQSQRLDARDTLRAARLQKMEKRAFDLLTILSLATYALFMKSIFGQWDVRGWIIAGTLASFAAVLAIFEIARRFPGSSSSYKTAYLFRICFVPLKGVSLVSSMFLHLVHGGEYFFVIDRMLKRTTGRARAIRAFVICVTPLALLAVFCDILKPNILGASLFPTDYSGSLVFATMVSISASIEYTHYLLDRQFFRFTNPINRKHIGPLFTSEPALSEVPETAAA